MAARKVLQYPYRRRRRESAVPLWLVAGSVLALVTLIAAAWSH